MVPGAETTAADVTGITPTIVFWCALGVAVAALLALLVRLLRPAATPHASPASTSPSPPAAGGE